MITSRIDLQSASRGDNSNTRSRFVQLDGMSISSNVDMFAKYARFHTGRKPRQSQPPGSTDTCTLYTVHVWRHNSQHHRDVTLMKAVLVLSLPNPRLCNNIWQNITVALQCVEIAAKTLNTSEEYMNAWAHRIYKLTRFLKRWYVYIMYRKNYYAKLFTQFNKY